MSSIQNLKSKKRRRVEPRVWSVPRPIKVLVKLTTLIAAMAGVLIGWAVLNKETAEEYLYYSDQLIRLEQDEASLKGRIDELQSRYQAMSSDSFEIERIAREKHLMMKPGEQIIVFTPPRPAPKGN